MLLKLDYIIKKYHLKINGIIHIGAHFGEEHEDYIEAGIKSIIYIEPSKKSFDVLSDLFGENTDVLLFNKALGAKKGLVQLNTETKNNGQSNSILTPKKHLEYYPSIQFTDTEEVFMDTLDLLTFPRKQYNMINIDVQGFELEVFKGSKESLKNIDYIYTEVNKEEVYENCAMVWELDSFLKAYGFERVETGKWQNNAWSDALYIKQSP